MWVSPGSARAPAVVASVPSTAAICSAQPVKAREWWERHRSGHPRGDGGRVVSRNPGTTPAAAFQTCKGGAGGRGGEERAGHKRRAAHISLTFWMTTAPMTIMLPRNALEGQLQVTPSANANLHALTQCRGGLKGRRSEVSSREIATRKKRAFPRRCAQNSLVIFLFLLFLNRP